MCVGREYREFTFRRSVRESIDAVGAEVFQRLCVRPRYVSNLRPAAARSRFASRSRKRNRIGGARNVTHVRDRNGAETRGEKKKRPPTPIGLHRHGGGGARRDTRAHFSASSDFSPRPSSAYRFTRAQPDTVIIIITIITRDALVRSPPLPPSRSPRRPSPKERRVKRSSSPRRGRKPNGQEEEEAVGEGRGRPFWRNGRVPVYDALWDGSRWMQRQRRARWSDRGPRKDQ